eukprot:3003975-Ditylum_brightwellii.AAC.1
MNSKEGEKETQHMVIPLLGEFKCERGEHCHLLLLADVTASGFTLWLWAEQVAGMLKAEGRTSGPVMCNSKGKFLTSSQVEEKFHAQLARVQLSHPQLIDRTHELLTNFVS